MPDPDFKTVSASQVPEMLNQSNWGTRLTLYHEFIERIPTEKKQNGRMRIGKLFEGMILEMTAERLDLEVIPNTEQDYLRHDSLPLGCTRDARVLCPTRGQGSIEAKAIDQFSWQRNWTEKGGPKMYEVQLQTQMVVRGDAWGALAVYIYNEGDDGRLIIYERKPIEAAQKRIITEAELFMKSVEDRNPPSAFGLPVEMETLNFMYPEVDPGRVIEASERIDIAELARMWKWASEQKASFTKIEKDLKPKLVQFMEDAVRAELAGGVTVEVSKSTVAGGVVMLPADIRKGLKYVLNNEGLTVADRESVEAAMNWAEITRKPGVQNRMKVIDREGEVDPPEYRSTLEAG